MWNCTLTTVQQGISHDGGRDAEGRLGYNRYISTLSDVPLAFLLIYGLLRSWDVDEDGDEDYTSQSSKVFPKIFRNLSLTHLFAHSLTHAVPLSFVLFSAVVTKASNFVANFKQIFRFPLSLCLSPSVCYCSDSYVRKVRFNLLNFLLFNFIKSTGQNKSGCRKKS